MKEYGYGRREEALYVEAFLTAKEGKPTLVFNFEKENFMFYRIVASYLLEIEMFRFEHEDGLLKEKLTEYMGESKLPIILVDKVSMTTEEICDLIQQQVTVNNITHVFLDRVSNTFEIDKIALKHGIKIKYLIEE